ncbi:IS110 family transposase, partial [Adlercreutzia sp. R25]
MLTEAATCTAVLGLDVGKFSHWACHVTRRGEVLGSGPVANTERDLDDLFGRVGAGTLVVVDQVRNIGSLAISRARLAGLPVAYLPGIAAHGAAKLFAGDAKTDERDAAVIAKTALGIPDSLLPVPSRGERLEAARSMAAQRSHMVACSTRDKNRLRSLLLESCPAFEALADLADPHWLKMMEALGGPWGIVDAGRATVGAVTRGANRSRIDEAVAAAASSTRPSEYRVAAENPQVRMLARRIRESAEEAARLD